MELDVLSIAAHRDDSELTCGGCPILAQQGWGEILISSLICPTLSSPTTLPMGSFERQAGKGGVPAPLLSKHLLPQ